MKLYYQRSFGDGTPTHFEVNVLRGDKIHTIRTGQRWQSGEEIEHVIGIKGNGKTFKRGKCISTQDIKVTFVSDERVVVSVDGRQLRDGISLYKLAKLEGLTVPQFIEWFYRATKNGKEPYRGQIVHFTHYKY